MKNLLFGGIRPLLACALFLSILFGCRKDTLLPSSEEMHPAAPAAQLPISVEEARDFFSNFRPQPSNSLDSDREHRFLDLDPVWAQAFVGHSPSGREIVVVPLADTSLQSLNHGRADAKLLFSKTGQDSIKAQVLVWVADSAHWAAQSGGLNFNTFTGAYLFFDVGLHFQYGIGVLEGSPVALVDSIGHSGGQEALDREEVPCIPTIDFFMVCEDDTPPPTEQVFTLPAENCWTTIWIWFDCPQGGGGGDHGGGGGGGGGNGTGNPPLPPPPGSFWYIFNDNVPLQSLQAFVQNGGTLPDGITLSDARRLIYLDSIYDLSQGNLQWLSNNTLFLPMICNYVAAHPSPTGDDLKAVAWLIALSQQCGLNFYQQYYLAGHLGEVGEFYNFAVGHNYSPASQAAVKAVIDARIVNSAPLPSGVLTQLLEIQVVANFGQPQISWLISNTQVIGQMFQFMEAHPDEPDLESLFDIHLELMMTPGEQYAILNQQAGYPDIGTAEWAGTMNFAVEEIPRTTVAERALAAIFPFQALVIFKNITIARDKQAAFWGSGGVNVTWLGKGDAFLHTYYQAINTQDVGAPLTKLFSDAYETEHPAVLHLETEMDLFNNGVGIQTGQDNLWVDRHAMADIVHQKILNGYCKYLDPVDHALSPP